jgi:membrane protease YdiL (CAAX protease family)
VSDFLSKPPAASRCSYCGSPLDSRVYFCPRCAKPHRPVEEMLPASLPRFENFETRLRNDARPAWTIFFSYLCVIAIGSMLAAAIWGFDDREPALLFVAFALAALTLFFVAREWRDVRTLLATSGMLQPAAWAGLLVLAPLLLLNFGYHHLLMQLLSVEAERYDDYFTSKWGPLVFICIMPAIVEEIGFRGIIQHQFEKVVSPGIAIGVASLVFSAAHFSVLSSPYLALVGMLLGWMKWKTGSLYPPILAHFLHNLVVISTF